jgi:hypothetical protein
MQLLTAVVQNRLERINPFRLLAVIEEVILSMLEGEYRIITSDQRSIILNLKANIPTKYDPIPSTMQ